MPSDVFMVLPHSLRACVLPRPPPLPLSAQYDFLERLARKFGKLHKGNEADIETTAKMVLNDLIRGKLPFFQEPPPPPPPGTTYTKQVVLFRTAVCTLPCALGPRGFGIADVHAHSVKRVDKDRMISLFAAQDLRAHDIKVREAKKDAANAPIGPAAAAAAAAAAMARVGAPAATGVLGKSANEGSEDESDEEGEQVQSAQVQPTKQKLSKLLCTHRFDDNDMHRGDGDLEELEDEEEGAFDSDDLSEPEEDEEDGEEEEEAESEGEGASRKRKRGADVDDDESGEESDVSLNEGADNSDSEEEDNDEEEEDAAAEAAWAEMELQAENGGAAGGKALGEETQKKINRTLLRRRRKAENKEKPDRSWAHKIGSKKSRETSETLPQHAGSPTSVMRVLTRLAAFHAAEDAGLCGVRDGLGHFVLHPAQRLDALIGRRGSMHACVCVCVWMWMHSLGDEATCMCVHVCVCVCVLVLVCVVIALCGHFPSLVDVRRTDVCVCG